jgi:hypothetical protein
MGYRRGVGGIGRDGGIDYRLNSSNLVTSFWLIWGTEEELEVLAGMAVLSIYCTVASLLHVM